jgi:predicted glycoside hydrolase/deacetylase ChbG (UPF0249 family)
MMQNDRKIIFTADDYGSSDFINHGILRGIEEGVINCVAVMVNFEGSREAVLQLKERHPHISIGLHANINACHPVAPSNKVSSLVDQIGQFLNLDGFLARINGIRMDEALYETRSQLERLESWGVQVEHLSSHHNVMQIYSPLFRMLLHLASTRGIALRSTRPLSRFFSAQSDSPMAKQSRKAALQLITKNTLSAMKFMKYGMTEEMEKNHAKMDVRAVAHPDYLGDTFWGNPTPQNLKNILHHLPEGITEMVFHLGSYAGYEEAPKGVDEDYFPTRELELFCICSSMLPHWLENEGIKTISFSELTSN